MPTIEVSKKDLFKLIGKKISDKELEEDLLLVKGEIEAVEGDNLKLEIADTNRPDLWSVEGIAREIKTKYGKYNVNLSKLKSSGLIVKVDKNLKTIRPRTVCAVVKNLNITEEVLLQMIQLQEKVCDTFGSKRSNVAIGVYDLHKITSPITFKAFKPHEIKFAPLEFNREMTLAQILRTHQKGKEYGYLLEGFDKYPVFVDAAKEVLSMPPIINSNHTGKITSETKDLFIECSGFSLKFLLPALNVIVQALADRGGSVETVKVVYPDETITTPNFKPKSIKVDYKFFGRRIGLDLNKNKVKKLLEAAHYRIAKDKGDILEIEYPAYRQDIMHPVDVMEDVVIRYGFNNLEPRTPRLITSQSILPINQFTKQIANVMVGLGAQEVLSYNLTNKDNLVKKMNLKKMNLVEISNPVSNNWSVFRTWITPQLIEFFSRNTNKEYPQQIFEIGEVVLHDSKAETKTINPTRLAWAKTDKNADFTHSKQAFDFLMNSLGIDYEIEETTHDSFIKGRVARVYVKGRGVAYIGEINPLVLENFGIDMPVCVFELNLTEIIKEVLKQ